MNIYTDPQAPPEERIADWYRRQTKGHVRAVLKAREQPKKAARTIRTFMAQGAITKLEVEDILKDAREEAERRSNEPVWSQPGRDERFREFLVELDKAFRRR